jgi:hypothetical protein
VTTLPDPRTEPTIDARRVAELFGISERAAYDAARRWIETEGAEGLPALRVSRSVRFVSAPIVRLLGFDVAPEPEIDEPSHLTIVRE